jgi:TP901 family phage tail tape measure protein
LQIADLFFRVRLDGAQRVSSQLTGLGRGMTSVGQKMKNVGSLLTKTVTLPLLGIGAAAIKTTVTFDKQMSRVSAVTGYTGKEFKTLRDLAQEMGRKTSKSATEAAQAMEYMGLAGWDLKDIQVGLEPVLRASEAGMMDLGLTSDLVTDSMAALNLKTKDLKKYLDIAANAQNNSNQSMQQFLEAMVTAGGLFDTFNVPLEEAGALLGVLADRGVKGSEAGNALISVMNNLTSGVGRAGDAMSDLGIEVYDSNGKFRGMTVILKDINKKFQGMTQEQKNTYMQMIGGKLRFNDFKKLLQGTSDGLETLTKKLYNSKGALSSVAKTMQDNTAGAMTRFKSILEGIGIQIGDKLTPLIDWLTDKLQKLSEWFYNLSDKSKNMILIFAGIAAAIPLVITGFAGLILVAGGMITAIGTIGSLIVSLISGVGLLLIPLGLLAGGFTLLTGVIAMVGLGELYNKFGSVHGIMTALKDFIINSFVPGLKYLVSGEGLGSVQESAFITKDRLQAIRNTMGNIKSFIIESLVPALKFLVTGEGLENVKNASNSTKNALNFVRQKMVDIYNFVMDSLIPSLRFLATGEKGSLTQVKDHGTNLKENLVKLRKQFESLKNYITGTLIPALSYLVTGDKGSLDSVKGISKQTKGSLQDLRKSIEKLLKQIEDFDSSSMVQQLSNIIGAVSAVIDFVGKAIDQIKRLNSNPPKDWGAGKGQGVGIDLKGHAMGVKNNPVGHWATVGERGRELMYVPPGASIYSNNETEAMLKPYQAKTTKISNKTMQEINNINIDKINIDPKEIKDLNDLIDLFKNIKHFQALNV